MRAESMRTKRRNVENFPEDRGKIAFKLKEGKTKARGAGAGYERKNIFWR